MTNLNTNTTSDETNIDIELNLTFHERMRTAPLQWLVIFYICSYVFLVAMTFFLRPDTTTNRFILNNFHITANSLGFLMLMTVPLIPSVYYVFRTFQAVVFALFPVIATDLILILQVLRSNTAPLEHMLAHVAVLISFFILFVAFEQLQIEREANTLLAQKNEFLTARGK